MIRESLARPVPPVRQDPPGRQDPRARRLLPARRVLRAEWTKLRTLPSTWWLLFAAIVLTGIVSTFAVASVTTEHCESAAACQEDTVKLSLTGVVLGQAAVAVLGVLAMGSEYGTGTIRTTVAAVPRRWAVLAAKAAVLGAAVTAAAALGVALSLLAGRLILPGNGFTAAAGYPPLSLGDGSTLRAAVGTVLYLGLVALLGLGLAAVMRDSAVAITLVLGLVYLFPVVGQLVSDPAWNERLRRIDPSTAGLAIQATRNLDRLAVQPWPGLGVLAAYAACALFAGGLLFRLRDT